MKIRIKTDEIEFESNDETYTGSHAHRLAIENKNEGLIFNLKELIQSVADETIKIKKLRDEQQKN